MKLKKNFFQKFFFLRRLLNLKIFIVQYILFNSNGSDIMAKKTYRKPILKVCGALKDITKASQDGTGDYAGRLDGGS